MSYFRIHLKYLLLTLILISYGCTECLNIYKYNPPQDGEAGLKVGSLEQVGMNPQVVGGVMNCIYANKYDQVHSILVYKDSLLVFEEYTEGNKFKWDGLYHYGERIKWHKDSLHTIMSTAKSITSAVVGIAVKMGYLNISDPIFNYLPLHQQYKKDGKEFITVEHLLTMTSGLAWDEWSGSHGTTDNDIDQLYFLYQNDPIAAVLARPLISVPGEKFTYNGGGIIILGEIIKNATGMDYGSFAKEYLFKPLGINSVYLYQFENGTFACEGSIYLRPRDMLKVGVLFLNDGMWNGKQIISREWVNKSSTPFRNNHGIDVPIDDYGGFDYGYTWWIGSVNAGKKEVAFFQAAGWGGQEIIVIPDLNMVVVFTGGNYVVGKHIFEMLEEFILASIK